MPRHIIEVETKTFVRFWLVMLGFLVACVFLYRIREALAIIGCAALLAIAIRPLALKIDRFVGRKKKGKLNLANFLAYSIVLLVILAAVLAIGPVIFGEFTRFASSLPDMLSGSDSASINSFGAFFGVPNLADMISSSLENLSSNLLGSFGANLFSSVGAVSGAITNVVVTLIMTLFFMIEGPEVLDDLWSKLSSKTKSSVEARRITSKMAWVVSTFVDKKILVAIINGIASSIFIFFLTFAFGENTSLALPLGMIAMFFCIIPMFGQFIGGISISLILLLNNPFMALVWAAYYSVYSVIESNVFEPKIQGNALDLRPLYVLIAVTIGTYALGFIGTLISIPIAGCIKVLLEEYPTLRKLSAKEQ